MRRLVVVVVVVLTSLMAGCTDPAPTSPSSSTSSSPPAVASAPRPQRTLQQPIDPPSTVAAAGDPVRVRVPRLRIDSRLDRLDVTSDGELQTPTSFARAGWFTAGVRPGDVGPAVIAGHVDSTRGPAVFFRLRDAVAGDRIEVTDRDGAVRQFVVTVVRRYAKTSFATTEVYGPTAQPQLRLITCTGDFDRTARSYRDNLVVFATLRGERAG